MDIVKVVNSCLLEHFFHDLNDYQAEQTYNIFPQRNQSKMLISFLIISYFKYEKVNGQKKYIKELQQMILQIEDFTLNTLNLQILSFIDFILQFQVKFDMVNLHSFKRLIYSFDLFCSSELLRYHSQTQYKTMTGGLLSLAIICVVVGGFASMVGDTLNRIAITSSLVRQKQSDPPFASLPTNGDEMFMLGLSIRSFDYTFTADLSSGPQYFSIVASNYFFTNGMITKVNPLALEKCTQDHWSIVPEFAASYDSYGVANWLCLPLGSSIGLQGTLTSSSYSLVAIGVIPCQNSTNNNNSCAPQSEIDALIALHKNFYLNFNYVNPVINPNEQNFRSFFVQGTDYGVFSATIGSESYIYFSDYTITSDDSILPFQHNTVTSGCIIEEKTVSHPYQSGNGQFARIYLAKSENSLVYKRQVQKISAVLSYIGGLVGAITALLFLIKSYTDTSLEVAIGLSLFEHSREQEQKDKTKGKKEKGFDMFGFTVLTVHRFLRFCGWKGKIERAQRLEQCQQEAIKQMDVQFLLRRVIKLETCVSKLFTPHQLKDIREGQPITFKSAKNMRNLLFNEVQVGSCHQKSSNNDNPPNKIDLKDALEYQQGLKGSNIQSGTSIFKIKFDKQGIPFEAVQIQSQMDRTSKLEESKIFNRPTVLKNKSAITDAKSFADRQDQDYFKNPARRVSPPIII